MTAAEHAATVRASIEVDTYGKENVVALVSLVWLEEQAARAEAAERERDEARSQRDYETAKMQAAEVRVAQLETALRELADAVEPKLGTMNYHFGPHSRTAVSRDSEDAWRRIKAAVVGARAVLAADRETET